MNVLVISDNNQILTAFLKVINQKNLSVDFKYGFTQTNEQSNKIFKNESWIEPINIKQKADELSAKFDIIISLHCTQLFPTELVTQTKCINVHPGLCPYNNGWFPHVFSLINGLPAGATIHEITNKIDQGPIIVQKKVEIQSWDDSESLYNKIMEAEIELIENHIESILSNTYQTISQKTGNTNYKKDFKKLCQIDLHSIDTFESHINHLKALSHGSFMNAYFYNNEGKKVFLKLELASENQ